MSSWYCAARTPRGVPRSIRGPHTFTEAGATTSAEMPAGVLMAGDDQVGTHTSALSPARVGPVPWDLRRVFWIVILGARRAALGVSLLKVVPLLEPAGFLGAPESRVAAVGSTAAMWRVLGRTFSARDPFEPPFVS